MSLLVGFVKFIGHTTSCLHASQNTFVFRGLQCKKAANPMEGVGVGVDK